METLKLKLKAVANFIAAKQEAYDNWLQKKDEEYRANPSEARKKLGWTWVKIMMGSYIVIFVLIAICQTGGH